MYDGELRICKFKAFPHPDVDAKLFRTNTYTLLDNVTGMYVAEPGDTIRIFLDDTHGQNVSVRVIDWVNYESFSASTANRAYVKVNGNYQYVTHTHSLRQGYNEIVPLTRGLMYIMCHTDDYANIPEMTAHFLTGEVNGYIELGKTDISRAYELLRMGGNTEPHFDMMSHKALINFPKAMFYEGTFKKNSANTHRVEELLHLFDTVMYIQEDVQGHYKYKALGQQRVHRNRALFHGTYTSYYGASSAYRTYYNVNSMGKSIVDPTEQWKKNVTHYNNDVVGSIWGLAHELGHTNQTEMFKWRGLTEVTNNLMCAITQWIFYGEGNTTMRFNNHFNRCMADMVTRWVVDPDGTERHLTYCESVNTPQYGVSRTTSDPNHQPMVDPTTQLMPFWQLYLYYHRALEKTDFYPDFYELCRLDRPIKFRDWFLSGGMESSADQEYAMYEFMVKASTAAGEDLSGFCNDWHLPGINNRMLCSHYGQSVITTTQEEIDKRVAVCSKFPKPEMNPLYINDLNIDLYRQRAKLSAGSYSVSEDGVYTMNGDWSGVAAWALVDPETERVMGIYQGADSQIKYRYYTSIYEAFDPEKHGYRGEGCPEDSPYLTHNNGYQRFMLIGPGVIRTDLKLYGVDVWGQYHEGTRVE